jgi:hypothetical protein
MDAVQHSTSQNMIRFWPIQDASSILHVAMLTGSNYRRAHPGVDLRLEFIGEDNVVEI